MELAFFLHGMGVCLMLAGAFFICVGSFGVWRMPDFFTRLHPASVSDSLGLPLIMAGVVLQGSYGVVSVKLLLLTAFAMVTSSTASHALAHAAIHSRMKPIGEVERKKPVKKAGKKKAAAKSAPAKRKKA